MKDPKTSLTVMSLLFACCPEMCIDDIDSLEENMLNLAKEIYLGYKRMRGEYLELPNIYLSDYGIVENPKMIKEIKEIFKTLEVKKWKIIHKYLKMQI